MSEYDLFVPVAYQLYFKEVVRHRCAERQGKYPERPRRQIALDFAAAYASRGNGSMHYSAAQYAQLHTWALEVAAEYV